LKNSFKVDNSRWHNHDDEEELIGIKTPVKIPKALIGMIGLMALAKNATAVVLEVTVMALTPLLNE